MVCYTDFTCPGFFFYAQNPRHREAIGIASGCTDAPKDAAHFKGGAVMRTKITLACSECKQRNYNTFKEKKNTPDRVELSKYCRFCRKHTVHRETK